jgi:hypothetical protein
VCFFFSSFFLYTSANPYDPHSFRHAVGTAVSFARSVGDMCRGAASALDLVESRAGLGGQGAPSPIPALAGHVWAVCTAAPQAVRHPATAAGEALGAAAAAVADACAEIAPQSGDGGDGGDDPNDDDDDDAATSLAGALGLCRTVLQHCCVALVGAGRVASIGRGAFAAPAEHGIAACVLVEARAAELAAAVDDAAGEFGCSDDDDNPLRRLRWDTPLAF